jgi:hypothetical protein
MWKMSREHQEERFQISQKGDPNRAETRVAVLLLQQRSLYEEIGDQDGVAILDAILATKPGKAIMEVYEAGGD